MSAPNPHHLTQTGHDKPKRRRHRERPRSADRSGVPTPAPARDDAPPPRVSPAAPDAANWPDPDLSLLGRPCPLPAFPADVLPPACRGWSLDTAGRAGTPLDYVALSLLAAGAGVIGGARRVSPVPSWSEPCVLWTALVGDPGAGRTRAREAALAPVHGVLGRRPRAVGRRDHAAHAEHARCLYRRWQKAVRDNAGQGGDLPPALPEEALEPPPAATVVTTEPAVAAVAEALRANPRGVLLSGDADGVWLRAMARDVRAGADGRFWLAAWSGTATTVHRGRQLPVDFDDPAVSVLGALSPEAIAPALAGDGGAVAARCLFAWPQRLAYRPLSLGLGPDATAVGAGLEHLVGLDDERRDVPLAVDALSLFEAFRQWHQAHAAGLDGSHAGWWRHGPGTVLRLAGVLTFLEWAAGTEEAEPAHIPAWAVRSAVTLWRDYLWPHARAVLRHGGGSDRQRRLEKVLGWLAAGCPEKVSREDIRREALSQKVDAAGADAVIAALVAAGWLRPAAPEKRAGAGRPAQRWLVNPAIATVDADDDDEFDGDSGPLEALDEAPIESGPAAGDYTAAVSSETRDQPARPAGGGPISAIPATPEALARISPAPSGEGRGGGCSTRDASAEGPPSPTLPHKGGGGMRGISAIPATPGTAPVEGPQAVIAETGDFVPFRSSRAAPAALSS